MKIDKPLSEKHKRFVRLVRAGRSATSAYAAAYNIHNSLSTRAASCRLMKDARIIAAINKGRPSAKIVNIPEKKPQAPATEQPPKYQQSNAPAEAETLAEALRRRLRMQAINPKGFAFINQEEK